MADEQTIRGVLVAFGALTTLIGGAGAPRLWDQLAPARQSSPITRPYIAMTTITDVPEPDLSTSPGIAALTIQFDIYADTKASAKAVLAQLRAALHAAGYFDSEQVARDLPAGDPQLRRISSDWQFWLPR